MVTAEAGSHTFSVDKLDTNPMLVEGLLLDPGGATTRTLDLAVRRCTSFGTSTTCAAPRSRRFGPGCPRVRTPSEVTSTRPLTPGAAPGPARRHGRPEDGRPGGRGRGCTAARFCCVRAWQSSAAHRRDPDSALLLGGLAVTAAGTFAAIRMQTGDRASWPLGPERHTPGPCGPGVLRCWLLVRVTVAVTVAVAVVFGLGRLLDDRRLGGENHPGHRRRVDHR